MQAGNITYKLTEVVICQTLAHTEHSIACLAKFGAFAFNLFQAINLKSYVYCMPVHGKLKDPFFRGIFKDKAYVLTVQSISVPFQTMHNLSVTIIEEATLAAVRQQLWRGGRGLSSDLEIGGSEMTHGRKHCSRTATVDCKSNSVNPVLTVLVHTRILRPLNHETILAMRISNRENNKQLYGE